MKHETYILILVVFTILTSCNNFENRFYDGIVEGQKNAIKNGADTFNLSEITDFEWDSVILIRGNESVPVFKEEIEEIINSKHESYIDYVDNVIDEKATMKHNFKTTDLSTNRHRFYFLTPNKQIIEKEIKNENSKNCVSFDIEYCFIDSIKERCWLSKKECRFILKSNMQKEGEGTVFLFPDCRTRVLSKQIKFCD